MAEPAPAGDVAQRPPIDAAGAKLRLVEALADADTPEQCTAVVLAWLHEHADVARAACLVVDEKARTLAPLATAGFSTDAERELTVELRQRGHPLVMALSVDEPLPLRRASYAEDAEDAGALIGGDTWTIVLGEPGAEQAHGLLLLGAEHDPDLALASFAARHLASRLAALWYDIAHRREQRRRRELSWLRQLLEAVPDPVLLTDSDGRTLVANHDAERLLSSEPEMSEGRRRAVALNNMLFSASLFTRSTPDEATRRELLLVDPVDGRDLLYELLSAPVEVTAGEVGNASILRYVGDLQRATEEIKVQYRRLRAAEAETRAERDRLDLILNSVVDPILVTDRSGKIVLMNAPAERLFTDPSGAGEEGRRRVQANDAVVSSAMANLYAGADRRWRGRVELTDPITGDPLPMEATAGKVASLEGRDEAVVTILRDLSEALEKAQLYEQVKRHSEELEARVREATAELAEQNELLRRQALELEEASRLKSQFLANVSHELRTPLNAIVGYASLLMEGVSGPISERQHEKLERLDANANHLLAIINDLLDISRIEAGKIPMSVERFSVPGLVTEVTDELEPIIDSSPIAFVCRISADLPELESDRQKVKQILLNLVSNALKFTDDGSVTVTAEPDGAGAIVIAVADTGIGISEENQQTIFEPFSQSDGSYARSAAGTGLGLTICRRLATILGGEISVASEVGIGSTFSLRLPAVVEGAS